MQYYIFIFNCSKQRSPLLEWVIVSYYAMLYTNIHIFLNNDIKNLDWDETIHPSMIGYPPNSNLDNNIGPPLIAFKYLISIFLSCIWMDCIHLKCISYRSLLDTHPMDPVGAVSKFCCGGVRSVITFSGKILEACFGDAASRLSVTFSQHQRWVHRIDFYFRWWSYIATQSDAST